MTGPEGGIPVRTNIFVNCLTGVMYNGRTNTAYKCHADGVNDDSAIINAAISACPSNHVVYIPAATYLITNNIGPSSPSKSYWTLRGDGSNTVLYYRSPSDRFHGIALGTAYYANTNAARVCDIYSGFAKGSSAISISNSRHNAGGIKAGMMLMIDQLNDPQCCTGSLVDAHGAERHSGRYDRPADSTRCIAQLVRVTGIHNVTNIAFWPPLAWNFSAALKPQAAQMAPSGKYVGLENFKMISDTNNNTGAYMIYWEGMLDSWISGVESAFAKRWHVRIDQCLFCQFRNLYVHEATAYTVGSGYGFEMSQSTSCLLEDSIFYHNYCNIMLEAGDTGCVVGYNYVYKVISKPVFYQMAALDIHAPHPVMDLWEGNVAPCFSFDHTHGSSSDQTIFRNRVAESDPGVTNNIRCIDFNAWSQSNNVVGNVLGEPTRFYILNAGATNNYSHGNNVVYRFGYPDMGNNRFAGITNNPSYPLTNWYDARIEANSLVHGNYDYASRATLWDPGIGETNLPPSLYYAGKPGWWGALPWPPIGPDLSPMGGLIPAEVRFNAMMNPPP